MDFGRLLHAALGVVLIVAAPAKRGDVALDASFDPSGWVGGGTLALICLEWAFGVWLVVGLRPTGTRRVATGVFLAFAMVSIGKAIASQRSCGCFGGLTLSPWYTATFDLVAAIALYRAPVNPADQPGRGLARGVLFATVALWGVVPGLVLPATALAAPARWLAMVDGVPDGRVDVDAWVGRRFPLAGHVDIEDAIIKGEWLVVFFREDCSACRAAFPGYARLAESQKDFRVALIEVPPYATGRRFIPAEQPSLRVGKLDRRRRWALSTPTALRLSDGVVRSEGPKSSPGR